MAADPPFASADADGPRRRTRRDQILDAAVDRASAFGLDGLTIGTLSTTLGMSKSGLFAHFGSKEKLQLAAIDWEGGRFDRKIAADVADTQRGLARLRSLVEAWTRHVESSGRSGGCFFAATSAEFGTRPGAVRDRLSKFLNVWLSTLAKEAEIAIRQGELAADADGKQLAFELHAYVQEANWSRGILSDTSAFERARRAIERTLRAATPHGEEADRD